MSAGDGWPPELRRGAVPQEGDRGAAAGVSALDSTKVRSSRRRPSLSRSAGTPAPQAVQATSSSCSAEAVAHNSSAHSLAEAPGVRHGWRMRPLIPPGGMVGCRRPDGRPVGPAMRVATHASEPGLLWCPNRTRAISATATPRTKTQLVRRLSRMEGQSAGDPARIVSSAEEYCVDILGETAALRAAVDALQSSSSRTTSQGCVRTAASAGRGGPVRRGGHRRGPADPRDGRSAQRPLERTHPTPRPGLIHESGPSPAVGG